MKRMQASATHLKKKKKTATNACLNASHNKIELHTHTFAHIRASMRVLRLQQIHIKHNLLCHKTFRKNSK